jgi:Zn-dependent protease with chaperone function
MPPRPRRPPRADYEEHRRERVGIELFDPRLILALFAMRALKWITRATLRFANGGFGLWLTRPLWGAYWRAREYRADAYAASLGQADELADFLETHTLIHDHPVPFVWLTEETHPPSELRIDRLRGRGGGTEPRHQRVVLESP